MEISQKWLGEGAKGVLDPGSKGLQRVFCTTQTLFCTGATLFFAPVQEDFGTLGPKHLLHPLLAPFGKFPFSGPLPEPWGRNTRTRKLAKNRGTQVILDTFTFLCPSSILKQNLPPKTKKLLTRVSIRVPGVHGKRGLERGWQKRLA